MSDTSDVISVLALRIAELRVRLEQLDQERKKVGDELDDCTARFSALAVGIERPSTGSGQMDQEITKLFRRHYNSYFTPKEITEHLLRLKWKVDMPYVRTKLARLAKRGKIHKAGHGRYMYKQ